MKRNIERTSTLPLGIVIRKKPGSTRWAKWVWQVRAVLPGAGPANWVEMRREGDTVEYHAGTVSLQLFAADTEAYLHGLSAREPSVFVILRQNQATHPLDVLLATVSPYEAQDYADSGEELVEKVPMPPALRAWVEDFIERHHHEAAFVKRKRDKKRIDLTQDGIGDARIATVGDVYASPALIRNRLS